MAITLEQLDALFDKAGLKHGRDDDGDVILSGFVTESYCAPDGEKRLRIIAELGENGEYLTFFAPKAFIAEGPHVDAFLRTCMIIQWRTKLIQFEYDPADGEIRPVIEFPIEDGTLTVGQLRRCMHGMAQLVDKYNDALVHALETGEVKLGEGGGSDTEGMIRFLEEMLAELREGTDPPQGAPPRGV